MMLHLAKLITIIFAVLAWMACPLMAEIVAVSPGAEWLYFGDHYSGKVCVWDLKTLRLVRVLDCRKSIGKKLLDGLALSPDGSKLVTTHGSSSVAVVWDTREGKRLHELRGHNENLNSVSFSPNGRYIGTCGWADRRLTHVQMNTSDGAPSVSIDRRTKHHSVILWDQRSTKPLRYMHGHGSDVNAIAFSPDSQFLLSGGDDGTAIIHSVETGKIVERINGQPREIHAVAFSDDGHRVFLGHDDGSIVLWDRRSASVIWEIAAHNKSVSSIACSKDGRFVLSGSWDGKAILWDAEKGTHVRNLSQLAGPISVALLPTSRHAVAATEEGTVNIWDLVSWRQVSLKASGNDWICYTPEGFFGASRQGGQLVSVVKELDVYSIDQFALWYNRPDVILENLGLGTKEIIDHFHKQYLRRLRRLDFREVDLRGDLHVPEVLIRNIEQNGKFVNISFDLKDDKRSLRKYNIYVNDVPIFGARGKDVLGNSISKTERIELTHGTNKIEVTCINEAGAESHRALASADYHERVKGDLYYIGFGVSEYKDSNLNLRYAAKDVEDLADVFSDMKGEQYNDVHIKTYLNEQVLLDNIVAAKSFLESASVDDTFVLFIAGHGVYDEDDEATYYYLTHDADITNISNSSADFELIENILQGIAPRNKLFLMDTCESGEVEEANQIKYYSSAKENGCRPRTTRAITVKPKGNKLKKKRKYLYDNDRYIYNDLLRRSGAIVFSSSEGGEFSYESKDIQNGFFTEEIMNALRTCKADTNNDKRVSIDELRNYVSKTVPKLTEDLQHPTVDRDNIFQKFDFPIVDE